MSRCKVAFGIAIGPPRYEDLGVPPHFGNEQKNFLFSQTTCPIRTKFSLRHQAMEFVSSFFSSGFASSKGAGGQLSSLPSIFFENILVRKYRVQAREFMGILEHIYISSYIRHGEWHPVMGIRGAFS